MTIRKRNRMMAQQPKKNNHYCPGCDRNHVGDVGKCEVCGYKATSQKPKLMKKGGPIPRV